MIRFFREAGDVEFDDIIAGAEEDLKRAWLLHDEGVESASQLLMWALRPLRRHRDTLIKSRPFREVAAIGGLTAGHLHNLAKAGKLAPHQGESVRKISLLEFRARRDGPAPKGSGSPCRQESRVKKHSRYTDARSAPSEPASIFEIS